MRVLLISLFILLMSLSASGQNSFSRRNFETDSSDIEIIKNSLYHCYTETYKYRDSVWFSVHFINDTTRLLHEGWIRKNHKRFGIWKEYNFDGELLYTIDYDNSVYDVNRAYFPYFDILEKMKLRADSLIISVYSKDFFEKHVRFDFDGYAYDQDGCVGDWTEPMMRKPTEFFFKYSVRLTDSKWQPEMICIELDSLGNRIPSNNYGFEDIKDSIKTFNIDINKAKESAISQGMIVTDTSRISEFLWWDRFKNYGFYNGRFMYYITDYRGKIEYKKENDRQGIVYKFDVYSFNPWSGELIEKKKMKIIEEHEKYSGYKSGLIPDND